MAREKGIVGEEVGEGRDYGLALGGVVGACKDHMELVTECVGEGAVRADTRLVGDVPAGDWGEGLVGREGAASASQAEEGDGGERGEKEEVSLSDYVSQHNLLTSAQGARPDDDAF